MAGVLIFPRGDGMLEPRGAEYRAALHQPVALGAFAETPPVVMIALPLTEGGYLTAVVPLALFLTAAEAFTIAHGDPRQGAKES